MDIRNTITKGMVQDVDPRKQPEGTWRDSRNGTITQYGNTYVWRPIKGTWQTLAFQQGEKLMEYCNIRNRYFALVLNSLDSDPLNHVVKVYELFVGVDSIQTEYGTKIITTLKWYGNNSELGLSHEHPVRIMFGVYENEDIQRIYWSDDWNQPRVINVGAASGLVTLEEKFVNFVPTLVNAYGTFTLDSIVTGGSCRAGSYFICWQLYTGDGYFTDWSYLSNPIVVTGGNATGSTGDDYQNFQGMAPDEDTSKAIRIKLTDLDSDYPSIRIAAFYSNDYNSAEPGIIFYDGSLSATEITVDYKGNENLGTLTLDELTTTSITVVKLKDMTPIKNRNIITNIKEREELDVTGMNTELKNDRMEVSIDVNFQEIPLDYGSKPSPVAINSKAPWKAPHLSFLSTILAGFWYLANAAITWQEWDTGPVHVIPQGSRFYATYGGDISIGIGQHIPLLRVKKYRKAGAVAPYNTGDYIAQSNDDDDYVWDETQLSKTHFYDFKNPIVANKMRGYPGGESIRLGAMFFDLGGRPFAVRWLKNTDITYGQGDITTPQRGNFSNNARHTVGYDMTTDGDGSWVKQINGRQMSIKISDLNITDIRDRISAFMIVRAPIVHQYLANGAIIPTYRTGNDTYQYPAFMNRAGDTATREKTYAFFCPEDILNAKGFQIQEGDMLENIDILWPYDELIAEFAFFDGYGTEDSGNMNYTFFQKFMLGLINGTNDNSLAGAEHEILRSIPFKIADHPSGTNLEEYDPDNPLLTYWEHTASNARDSTARYGKLSDHSLLILDIDESGNDLKVPFNLSYTTPRIQLCALKRTNNNPYGGTGESSLANTIYMGVGHIQLIDDAILAEIESNGLYIFNEIEIFGGDTYIQLFDIQRCYKYQGGAEDDDAFSHAITFPVETQMLIGYREGEHHARTRYYDPTNNQAGLRFNPAVYTKTEDFNYNDGYSTDHAQDFYLPLPFNFTLQSEYSVRFRYTNQKVYSELQDSYRTFPAGNVLDIDTTFGEVNNIRSKFGRIVYWQDDAVGYIPIHERQLNQTEIGNPVQIGIGGVFERFDELIETIGNQQQFGLVESDIGFHWIDSRRKVHVALTNSFKIDESSITRGLDTWLKQNIPHGFDDYDNPGYDFGIAGGYDAQNRIVFHSISLPGQDTNDAIAIGFDLKINAFVGFFDFPTYKFLKIDNLLFGMSNRSENERRIMYYHMQETAFNMVYGEERDSYLEFIIKDDSMDPKIFDTMVVSSSEWFANSIDFEVSEGLEVQSVSEVPYTMPVLFELVESRNYKFRNKKWYFNVPRINRERLLGDFMKVRFTYNHTLHRNLNSEVRDITTTYRKAY